VKTGFVEDCLLKAEPEVRRTRRQFIAGPRAPEAGRLRRRLASPEAMRFTEVTELDFRIAKGPNTYVVDVRH
jgi:hypothetical protein